MDRALPGRMVDLIHEGVPATDLVTERADRAVWNALFATAASANLRGWHQWQWEDLIFDANSHLGQQARRRGRGKVRTPEQFVALLDKAWTSADGWLEEQPPAKNRDEMRAQGNERARAVLAVVEDPAALLTDAERAVLDVIARAVLDRNAAGKAFDRVMMPRHKLLPATGLGLTALRTALHRLDERGLLVLVEKGRPRGPAAKQKARANVYGLPTLSALRSAFRPIGVPEDGSVVPPAQICGAPSPETSGAPPQLFGAPSPATDPEAQMVTLTLSAPDPEQLAAALALVRREVDVHVQATRAEPAALPANVTPMPVRRKAS